MTNTLVEIIRDAAMWIAVGLAIIAAINHTENMNALWFFIIPAVVSLVKVGGQGDDEYTD